MDDQLDNDLKNHIKEVFDNFEDTSADEGWLELRKKFPEEESNRRVFVWIWWGATAAFVLLFLGIGIWMYTKKQVSTQFAQHQIKQNINKSIAQKAVANDTLNQIPSVKPAQVAIILSPHLADKNAGNLKQVSPKIINGQKSIEASKIVLNDSSNRESLIAAQPDKKAIVLNKAPNNQLAVTKQNSTNAVIAPSANAVSDVHNNQLQPAKTIVNRIPDQQLLLTSKGKTPVADVIVQTYEVAKTKPKAVITSPTVATPNTNNQQKATNVVVSVTPDQQLVAKTKPTIVITPPTVATPNTNKQQQAANVAESVTPAQQLVAKTKPIIPAVVNTPPSTVPITPAATGIVNNQQHKKNINDMFAEDLAKTQKKDEVLDKDDKKIRFGVYAATYFNYAKGSNNQINAGAGFTSDIALSKNLKLVTGLAINQNTLSYAGTTPTAASQNDLILVASTSNYGNVGVSMATGPNNLGATNLSPSSGYSSSFITLKNYNASLIGLDIPVNLKYEFNPLKHNLYVLAGFSSGTFINEAYTYQYNYPSITSAATQQPQSETTTKNFNSFYFAKTLNLGFGVGYALGKNNMVIEPFLKYPLEGLGTQQIRFGEGGINLKFNFSSKK